MPKRHTGLRMRRNRNTTNNWNALQSLVRPKGLFIILVQFSVPAADKISMKKPSINDKSSHVPLDEQALCRQLRLKSVSGNWETGRLLDRHFGEDKRAKPDDIRKLVKSLNEQVRVSENHIYKCRQFFTLFRTKKGLTLLLKRGVKWRRVIQLLGVKRLAMGMKVEKEQDAALKKVDKLIEEFPGSGKSKEFRDWTDKVEKLRVKLRMKDSGFFYEDKLLISCKLATLYRLDWAAAQFDKISKFASQNKDQKEIEKYEVIHGKLHELVRLFQTSYPEIRQIVQKKESGQPASGSPQKKPRSPVKRNELQPYEEVFK